MHLAVRVLHSSAFIFYCDIKKLCQVDKLDAGGRVLIVIISLPLPPNYVRPHPLSTSYDSTSSSDFRTFVQGHAHLSARRQLKLARMPRTCYHKIWQTYIIISPVAIYFSVVMR
jgi:hypothetical protein